MHRLARDVRLETLLEVERADDAVDDSDEEQQYSNDSERRQASPCW